MNVAFLFLIKSLTKQLLYASMFLVVYKVNDNPMSRKGQPKGLTQTFGFVL